MAGAADGVDAPYADDAVCQRIGHAIKVQRDRQSARADALDERVLEVGPREGSLGNPLIQAGCQRRVALPLLHHGLVWGHDWQVKDPAGQIDLPLRRHRQQ
eukprot:757646-Alexandrium_andersonii.AAC.1